MVTPPADWFPRRGEVYVAQLDKKRPIIVLSADFLNRRSLNVSIVPLTSVERRRFICRVPMGRGTAGLQRDSWAKCDGVVTMDKSSVLFPPLGTVPARVMIEIEQAVKIALDLP
jgi:mRNA-degrading endonuclease toxin of MazEF toxin-antitoxin module